MSLDLHNNIQVKRCISPVAIGTTGTGQTGKVIDRNGFEGVEYIISYGTITSTTAVYTFIAKEGDATGTMTSIADGDLLGTESAATPGTGTRTSGTTKNVTKRLGYIGAKRYVSCVLKSAGTAGTPVGVDILMSNPRKAPVAT